MTHKNDALDYIGIGAIVLFSPIWLPMYTVFFVVGWLAVRIKQEVTK